MCGSSPVYNGNEETGGGSSTPLPSLTNSSGGIDDQRAARTAEGGRDSLQELRPKSGRYTSGRHNVTQRRTGAVRRTMLALTSGIFKG